METTRPVIIVVDDDRETLETITQALESRYGSRYQMTTAVSFQQAEEELARLKLANQAVALVIVACELDGCSGSELIQQAAEQFPRCKRVLLASFQQKDTVVQFLNQHNLDNYLLKPIRDPQDELLPTVEDLLQDWQMSAAQRPDDIRIVGYRWSAMAHVLKTFLARNLIPYRWIEIEESPEAAGLIQAAGLDDRRLPVVFLPDETHLVQPTIEALAENVGLQQQAGSRFYDLVVVGGGPAGLSAAVYSASEGLDTLLIEAEAPGGQAGQSSRIENYLGFPSGLSGNELTRRAVAQARRFGVEILTPQEATGVSLRGHYRLVHLADGSQVACHALLIATGVSYRRLAVPGEEQLTGAGVYYGTVVTEALSCSGRDVFILGGGNSAGQSAMYLSRFASQITMVTIEDSLAATMSQYLVDQINATHNIRLRFKATISAVHGEDHLEAVTLHDFKNGKSEQIPAVALFIYIGMSPRTGWLKELVACDEQGYILTGSDLRQYGQMERFQALGREPLFLESSVPGIFAAGDTRHGSVKRIASGVGEGAMAVTLIHNYMAKL
jgi:thioredoxin reductase (NADPH)